MGVYGCFSKNFVISKEVRLRNLLLNKRIHQAIQQQKISPFADMTNENTWVNMGIFHKLSGSSIAAKLSIQYRQILPHKQKKAMSHPIAFRIF